jgi:hypothetical protein
MATRLRKLLFWGFIILLSLSVLQAKLLHRFIKEKSLYGSVAPPRDTALSFNTWFSADYQGIKEKKLNYYFGFRTEFIKLHNQLEWSLFKSISSPRVISGKNDFLFYQADINGYNGTIYSGVDSIKTNVIKLKYINNVLEKLNKKLLVIIAPNKSDIYSELLPDSLQAIKGPSNYSVYAKLLKEDSIPFIDFNKYFKAEKSNSPFPLFSPYGSHYSIYGACKAGDSIIHYIEKTTGEELPLAQIDSIKEERPTGSDVDLIYLMNLSSPLQCKGLLAYPAISIKENKTSYKPKVLIIGDSFFSVLIDYYHILNFFSAQSSFWYYNKQKYSGGDAFQMQLYAGVNYPDIDKEIMKYDVIIIMTGTPNINYFISEFVNSTCNKLK